MQLDGAGTQSDSRVVVIGATNRPEELDEAARRRLVKRLYIPLPDERSRTVMLRKQLERNKHNLTSEDFSMIAAKTEGFSGSNMLQYGLL